jgi:carbon storage regulator
MLPETVRAKTKSHPLIIKEKGISKTAQREIAEILMREKRNQSHVSGEETVTYKKR